MLISSDSDKFSVNKAFLQMSSDVFAKMVICDQSVEATRKEATIKDMTGKSLYELLRFFYWDCIAEGLLTEVLLELVNASQEYML